MSVLAWCQETFFPLQLRGEGEMLRCTGKPQHSGKKKCVSVVPGNLFPPATQGWRGLEFARERWQASTAKMVGRNCLDETTSFKHQLHTPQPGVYQSKEYN
eukprot:scaffold21858_cov19-Tisochrysis_lutea.AAC.2